MPIQIRVFDDAIIISNSCILPEGWTVDTLMKPHDSKPYNPDIANVFYRAGFIENWGQGIQKICDECEAIGAEIPVYELLGTTLRIQFKALERALIDQPKAPKHQSTKAPKHQSTKADNALEIAMAVKIIEILQKEPAVSQDALAKRLDTTRRIIQKNINILKADGRIKRIGGKRYGHWEVY